MHVTIQDVKDNVWNTDEVLDVVIAAYILGHPSGISVEQWRLDNYALLRQEAYPPMADYLDAHVKLSTADPVLQAEGQAQLDQYYADCLAVKARFPKP
jgi:hypothetical protein